MADLLLYLNEAQTGVRLAEYRPQNVTCSIRNSEAGDFACELALGQTGMSREQFGPYRTDYQLYRAGSAQNYRLLVEGMLTSVNLNTDRDSVLLTGKDWIHYLERRVYPFDPVLYQSGQWDQWPVGWPHAAGTRREMEGNPVEVQVIVEDILDHMMAADLPALPGGVSASSGANYQLPLIFNNVATGKKTKYTILPGDTTTIFDHLTRLSDAVQGGFEFDIRPQSYEFKMWSPDRMRNDTMYFIESQRNEAFGQIVELDWTNEGPDGTFLVGLGTGDKKAGAVWYFKPSLERYRWLDKVYDFGEMKNTDRIFQMLKDQNDLYPQLKLGLTLLNPEYLTYPSGSFYTGGRPRDLIGQRINVQHLFPPYWQVEQDHKVNAINWTFDESMNELVELELEVIYEEGIAPTP